MGSPMRGLPAGRPAAAHGVRRGQTEGLRVPRRQQAGTLAAEPHTGPRGREGPASSPADRTEAN